MGAGNTQLEETGANGIRQPCMAAVVLHRDLSTAQLPYRQAAWPVSSIELQWWARPASAEHLTTTLLPLPKRLSCTHPAQLYHRTFQAAAGAAAMGQTMDVVVDDTNYRCRILRTRKVDNGRSLKYLLHVLGTGDGAFDVFGTGRHVSRQTSAKSSQVGDNYALNTKVLWASLAIDDGGTVTASNVEAENLGPPLELLRAGSAVGAGAPPPCPAGYTVHDGGAQGSRRRLQAPSLLSYISATATRQYWQHHTSGYYAARGTEYWR